MWIALKLAFYISAKTIYTYLLGMGTLVEMTHKAKANKRLKLQYFMKSKDIISIYQENKMAETDAACAVKCINKLYRHIRRTARESHVQFCPL